jgi:hypothetical protein
MMNGPEKSDPLDMSEVNRPGGETGSTRCVA